MRITEAAKNKVDQVLNGEGFLEICLEGGGCSGYQIKTEGKFGDSLGREDAFRYNFL